jgi:hypothetical protein
MRLPWHRKTRFETWRWRELAEYNRRVSRGIVHTPTYMARMAEEQRLFDEEQLTEFGQSRNKSRKDGSDGE